MQLSDLEDVHGFHSRRAVAVQIDDTPRRAGVLRLAHGWHMVGMVDTMKLSPSWVSAMFAAFWEIRLRTQLTWNSHELSIAANM